MVRKFQYYNLNLELFPGFQGDRVFPKTLIGRSYITSNALPTIFYTNKFSLSHLDPAKDNFFLAMDEQIDSKFEWSPECFEIVGFDAYQVVLLLINAQLNFLRFIVVTISQKINPQ
jgi:hypothetical protein